MSTTSYNRAILSGNLTSDPESRKVKVGEREVVVCDFTLAVDRLGSREADYFDVTAWRELADIIGRYKKKGEAVLVEGRLQYARWTDETGAGHSKVKVVAESVRFLESGPSARIPAGSRAA